MLRKTNKYNTLFFVLGALALCVMVYHIGFEIIVGNISETGWWFAAIVGIWLPVYLLNAWSWRVIIHDEKSVRAPFWTILKLTVSGYAINYVTPVVALGGEPYRILELQRHVGGKKATSSVLLYSMIHMTSHLLFWLTAAVLAVAVFRPSPAVNAALGVAAALCVAGGVCFLKAYRKGLLMKTIRIANKIPFVKKMVRKISAEQLEKINETDQQIAHLYTCRRSDFYKSLALEYLARIVSCLEVYFIVLALGLNFTFINAVIIIAITSLIANILFFAPMQLGAREGGFMLAFQGIATASGLGIYVSLITRIREAFWILIGLILMKIKEKKHDEEIF